MIFCSKLIRKMGLSETKIAITPPLNTSGIIYGDPYRQATLLTLLDYMNHVITLDGARCQKVLDSLIKAQQHLESPRDMLMFVADGLVKANASSDTIANLTRIFFTRSSYGDEDNSSDTMTMCLPTNLTTDMLESFHKTYFWVEGIAQFVVGILGIIANTFAIQILCSNRLVSFFNSLLACLLVMHTIYILSNLLVFLSHKSTLYIVSATFSYVLYPLRSVALHSSTYTTVLMARQRYLAIRHPIEYRNATIGINPWKPTFRQMAMVLLFASVLVAPLVFETKFEMISSVTTEKFNSTHSIYVSSAWFITYFFVLLL